MMRGCSGSEHGEGERGEDDEAREDYGNEASLGKEAGGNWEALFLVLNTRVGRW
jgi:hypothetical protein